MAKKRKMIKLVKGISYMVIGCALMIVLFSSAMNVLQRQDDIAVLEKQKAAVEKEREELQNEVELLNDDDYVARYARENYIFSREGEQVSIIPGVE
ncbi:septum formation initiator family protein [uncultured Thomasclavelia sp.]|uniref:FtsB family cell division protein n=1 Tax=uncultured Thomasclavelia sp. TaxID=3025759 RepID=UPI0025F10E99|nr:septum formation initiator family protein [uncultured Thomasclavelia sp.]